MIIKRKMTAAQAQELEKRKSPAQEEINQAASDLFVYLLNRIEDMEARNEKLLSLQDISPRRD